MLKKLWDLCEDWVFKVVFCGAFVLLCSLFALLPIPLSEIVTTQVG